MKYILLIYEKETNWHDHSEEEARALMDAYCAYNLAMQEAGKLIVAEPLEPTSTATSVRVRDGQTLTIDGPFAETKEQLGGLYIMEAENLDEAIEWASKAPVAASGTIEIRPIMQIPY